jgi:hypothetical protein
VKTLLFLLLATLPCFARIGETEVQLIARYGQPTDIEIAGRAKQETFHKDGFIIEAILLDGKVVYHLYGKEVGDNGKISPLTSSEAEAIFQKEAPDYLSWEHKPGPTLTDDVWKKDGLFAMSVTGCFTIRSEAGWYEADVLLSKARADKETKGL